MDTASVVIKGGFVPQVLSPGWLLGSGLIGRSEHDQAEVEVITRDLAVFTCGWLSVHATRDSLQVSTADPDEFERVRDVAVGTLERLKDTPIGAMGINRAVHFTVGSVDRWHAVGDALAPKAPWESVLSLPGMRSMAMMGIRQDLYGGYEHVRVEPSVLVPTGVFIEHNDHFTLKKVERQPENRDDVPVWEVQELQPSDLTTDSSLAVEILSECWSASMQRAQAVVDVLTRLAGGAE